MSVWPSTKTEVASMPQIQETAIDDVDPLDMAVTSLLNSVLNRTDITKETASEKDKLNNSRLSTSVDGDLAEETSKTVVVENNNTKKYAHKKVRIFFFSLSRFFPSTKVFFLQRAYFCSLEEQRDRVVESIAV